MIFIARTFAGILLLTCLMLGACTFGSSASFYRSQYAEAQKAYLTGHLSSAERHLKRILFTNPAVPAAAYDLQLAIYESQGDCSQILKFSARLHHWSVRLPRAPVSTALCMLKLGRPVEAVAAVALEPMGAGVACTLGLAYEAMAAPQTAISHYSVCSKLALPSESHWLVFSKSRLAYLTSAKARGLAVPATQARGLLLRHTN